MKADIEIVLSPMKADIEILLSPFGWSFRTCGKGTLQDKGCMIEQSIAIILGFADPVSL